MEQQYKEMGNRIQVRRKELRIKQAELAEALDISNNHMSSIENGKQNFFMEKEELISKFKLIKGSQGQINYYKQYIQRC